ncbi:3-deoxy-7-phosphoheptulonate synthase [Methyloversatilis sp.]|uniref:3-deoxy-7-phosphoheptulonate synthase n=1 Tax=Methyloversatilis sp. TaxID=2569862 RepID=UPI0027BA3867|nr:3-deoxy-7-phosphoheptulonate synthase [Methyloversatilis sp.]
MDSDSSIEDGRIESFGVMAAPVDIKNDLPLSAAAAHSVNDGRAAVRGVLERSDPRLLVVVGPCSMHDPVACMEYARRLHGLAAELAGSLLLVMRVYFEKPRTTTGWKGYINDPFMDDSFRIEEGMRRARRFLLDVAELGLPAATEALDPISPQYLGDLVSWTAIGARTSESQTHREMASGLSTPVGFKNATDGDVDAAINAIISASRPHSFLGISRYGRSSIIRTRGNPHGHLVLRGGAGRPNYDSVSVKLAEQSLIRAALPPNIVVDCSHANSFKKPEMQPLVLADVAAQIRDGNCSIVGVMIESHLEAGNQPIPKDLSQLRHGCSVTDACVDWATTERILRELAATTADALQRRRPPAGRE